MAHSIERQDQELFVCPACGSSLRSNTFCRSRDYLTGAPFEVKECSGCGVGWTSPVPGDMEQYYPRRYRRYVPAVAWMLSRLYGWRVRKWCRGNRSPGKAIEIGCGDGVILAALRRRGWTVCGTERTDAMAATARERYGIRVYVSPERPVPGHDCYDLIVLFQVLEHLNDPVEALRNARDLLANRGRIIVGVPNLASWQARLGRDKWLHLDVPRHLVHFTPKSLAGVAKRVGLRLEGIRFASPEHDPYGWIQTILNRWGSNENRLTKLLMGIVPWRFTDLLLVLAAIILCPFSITLAVISWGCRAGAIIEATLVGDDDQSR
jgi:SAM-dependent methyltransferase